MTTIQLMQRLDSQVNQAKASEKNNADNGEFAGLLSVNLSESSEILPSEVQVDVSSGWMQEVDIEIDNNIATQETPLTIDVDANFSQEVADAAPLSTLANLQPDIAAETSVRQDSLQAVTELHTDAADVAVGSRLPQAGRQVTVVADGLVDDDDHLPDMKAVTDRLIADPKSAEVELDDKQWRHMAKQVQRYMGAESEHRLSNLQSESVVSSRFSQQLANRTYNQMMQYQHLGGEMKIGAAEQVALPFNAAVDDALSAEQEVSRDANAWLNVNSTDSIQVAPTSQVRLTMPITNSAWSSQFSERMFWSAQQNMSRAEIHLNPAELGPLSAKIKIEDDKTSLVFMSQHAQVREAVESAMPKLRMMFEDSEMELQEVLVTDQRDESLAQQFADAQHSLGNPGKQTAEESATVIHAQPLNAGRANSLVDYYA